MAETEAWPDDVRSRALTIAAELGPRKASEATGVPEVTISSWMARALDLLRPLLPIELQSARSWREAREPLLTALGPVAARTLVAYLDAVETGKARDARDLMVSFGIAVDKAQLLAGDATSRTDVRSLHANLSSAQVADEIRQLEERLGYPKDDR